MYIKCKLYVKAENQSLRRLVLLETLRKIPSLGLRLS